MRGSIAERQHYQGDYTYSPHGQIGLLIHPENG